MLGATLPDPPYLTRARRLVEAIFGLDPRSLALFRILLGAVLFADTLAGLRGLAVFFTDDGVLPREAASHLVEANVGFSAHFLGGSLASAAVFSALTAAAALAFAAGFRTRVASIALFLLTLSAQIRNPLVLQGSDYIARVVLFWSLFLPLGERGSIDSLRSPDPRRRSVVVSAATAGFLIQIALIYWASAAQKTDAAWRQDGTAVYYVLNIPSIATPLGRVIGGHPDLCRALTFATLGIEFIGPALLFLPCISALGGALRLGAVALFMAFHLALHLCMRLGPFSYITLAVWTAFLPPLAWERLMRFSWPQRLAAWAIHRIRWLGSPSDSNVIQSKSASIRLIFTKAAGALAAAAIGWILWLNAGTLLGPRFQAPTAVARASLAIGLAQEWGMFAPSPPRGDTWLVFEGTLNDGRPVDALGDGAPVDWDHPLPAPFPGSPGENYTSSATEPPYKPERRYLARWICRRWDAAHPADRLQSIRIRLVIAEVALPSQPIPRKSSSILWEQRCSD